jgi:hypothetical protein
MDNKLQGLEMLNELAAHGFIDNDNDYDDECHISEEVVQGTRAITFKIGNVAVSMPKLGGASSFKGYLPGSKLAAADQKTILKKLQSIMHDRAIPQATPPSSASASPTSKSTSSNKSPPHQRTKSNNSSSSSKQSSTSSKDTSLEDSGLIKFVKVH